MKARATHVVGWMMLAGAFAGGCRGRAATVEDCHAVLDRLVDLELAESGFHDPALAERWRSTLRARFANDLVRCEGRRVPSNLGVCLTAAQSPEEITHRCLE
jgi:hypothetical protein